MDSVLLNTRLTVRFRSALLLLALPTVVALSACGTKYSPSQSAPRPTAKVPATLPEITPGEATLPEVTTPQIIRPTTMTPPSDPVRSLPAAIALREQAALAADANNHSRAIGLLERAIRISPQDPLTFEALAENHLAMNRPGQALQLVRRGLSLNPTSAQRESLTLLAEKCQAML